MLNQGPGNIFNDIETVQDLENVCYSTKNYFIWLDFENFLTVYSLSNKIMKNNVLILFFYFSRIGEMTLTNSFGLCSPALNYHQRSTSASTQTLLVSLTRPPTLVLWRIHTGAPCSHLAWMMDPPPWPIHPPTSQQTLQTQITHCPRKMKYVVWTWSTISVPPAPLWTRVLIPCSLLILSRLMVAWMGWILVL